MESKEKHSLLSIISSALILGGYAIYVYSNYISGQEAVLNDFSFWGKAFLVLIPVSIVAQIILHIVFAIGNKIVTNEDLETATDERDRHIDLKAVRISHWVFIAGFLLAMASQAAGMPVWVMFVLFVLSGFMASAASEIAKIIYYRRGI